MSNIIRLPHHLQARGRTMLELGRRNDAKTILERLLSREEVPSDVRADTHRMLATIELDCQRFRKARRHLLAAIALNPADAESHYQMAIAIDLDWDANPRRALGHLQQATQLCPQEARYWSGLGQIAIRLGKLKTAYRAFCRASRLESSDVDVLEEIVDGLTYLHRSAEAHRVLMQARFRMPNSQELAKLWDRFRFDLLQKEQNRNQHKAANMPATLLFPSEPAPVDTIPMIAEEPVTLSITTTIRKDSFSRPLPHLPTLAGFQPPRSH